MNTNRGSYLLGAVLGSAFVLALCAPVTAADIYDGGLKGGYDVPPPPPSDRGNGARAAPSRARPDAAPRALLGRGGGFLLDLVDHRRDLLGPGDAR